MLFSLYVYYYIIMYSLAVQVVSFLVVVGTFVVLVPGVELSPAKVKLQELSTAIPLARNILSLISQRYEYDTSLGRAFMLMQSSLSEEDFDHLKYSLAMKMLTKEKSSYLMIFGGSSVTAGHDNQFLDSYTSVVSRELGPTLEAAGITLDVRNIAQGANLCLPSDLCYPAMGGEEEADLYSWEQSMNCGRQVEYPELIMRLAASSGGMYYHASSGGVRIDCKNAVDTPPYSSLNFTARKEDVAATTREEMLTSVTKWKQELFAMNELAGDTGSAAIPKAFMSKYNKKMAIGGFDKPDTVYPDSVCAGITLGAKKCTVEAIYASCGLKFLTKEASVYGSANGGGAPWHPSRGLHLLRGELLVWQYALATLDALLMLTADARLQTPQAWLAMRTEYSSKLKTPLPRSGQQRSLPPPILCGADPTYCHLPYSCYTNFGPHFSHRLSLTELAVPSTRHNRWHYMDVIVPNNQPDRPQNQLERRPRYQTSEGSSAGELFFQIHVTADLPSVMLCWGAWTKVKQLYFSHIAFQLDLHQAARGAGGGQEGKGRDGLYSPSKRRVQWDDPENKLSLNNCVLLRNIPPGSHVLGMESKLNNTVVGVTHIIMWGDDTHTHERADARRPATHHKQQQASG